MTGTIRFVLSLALVATGTLPATAAASTGSYWAQIGIGYLAVSTVVISELRVFNRLEETKAGDPSRGRLEIAAAGIGVAYPVVTAGALYLTGEALTGPSARKTRTWGLTTLASTAQSVILIGIGYAIISGGSSWDEVTVGGVIAMADVFSKPFTTAFWYNRFKEPAASADDAVSRLGVEPYVCTAAASDGIRTPLYGVTVSF